MFSILVMFFGDTFGDAVSEDLRTAFLKDLEVISDLLFVFL